MLTVGLERTTHRPFRAPADLGLWARRYGLPASFRFGLTFSSVVAAIDLGGHTLAHRLPGRETEGSRVPLPVREDL